MRVEMFEQIAALVVTAALVAGNLLLFSPCGQVKHRANACTAVSAGCGFVADPSGSVHRWRSYPFPGAATSQLAMASRASTAAGLT